MFLRILLWAIAIFFLGRFIWKVVSAFLGGANQGRPTENVPQSNQTREEFDDVREAKFVDVPKSAESDSEESSKQE